MQPSRPRHLTQLPEEVDGWAECLAMGAPWLHLRMCLECGHVGCCDDSPNRHATAHAQGTSHPIIRSLERGEDWSWCYVDQVAMLTPDVKGTTREDHAAGRPRLPPGPFAGPAW